MFRLLLDLRAAMFPLSVRGNLDPAATPSAG
jgi:hypothetical protein